MTKTIIEAIKDPLTHIIRNACDHGIETPETRLSAQKSPQGKLTLSAFHEGGNVNIEFTDDGAGIDPQRVRASALERGLVKPDKADKMTDRELVNLVFLPGFSTAKQISSISGRGVGMDVVKTNIERIGGTIDLVSRPGLGVSIKIKIPLTLAIVPGLVVTSAGQRFIVPQASLLELIHLEPDKAKTQIEFLNGAPIYRRRGHLLALTRLTDVLNMSHTSVNATDAVNIVVLQAEERHFGLIVDEINDTQEIVVKPFGSILKSLRTYAGATIMADGKVALILDVPSIAQVSGVLGDARQTVALQTTESASSASNKQELLLFRSGTFGRLAVPLSLVARLEEISLSRLEHAAGGLVIQYRGQILPLISLAAQLGCGSSSSTLPDPLSVVVFANEKRRFGLIVDNIVDIVEENITVMKASEHQYLLGSAVVGGKVTDFLDTHAIMQSLDQSWRPE